MTEEQNGLVNYLEHLIFQLRDTDKPKQHLRTAKRLRGAVDMLLQTMGEPKPKEWAELTIPACGYWSDSVGLALPSMVFSWGFEGPIINRERAAEKIQAVLDDPNSSAEQKIAAERFLAELGTTNSRRFGQDVQTKVGEWKPKDDPDEPTIVDNPP